MYAIRSYYATLGVGIGAHSLRAVSAASLAAIAEASRRIDSCIDPGVDHAGLAAVCLDVARNNFV